MILFYGFLFFISACQSKLMTSKANKENEFTVLYASEFGGSGELETRVITSSKEFREFWEALNGQPADEAPSFDENTQTVLIQNFESQRSGGSTYAIETVEFKNDSCSVYYSVKSPDAYGLNAITSPILVVLVNRKGVENPQFVRVSK